MGRINFSRVVLGGIVAGLVINVGEFVLHVMVIAKQMEEVVQARNLPAVAGQAIVTFVLQAFALGIATVWLYAAIRPRFGAGARTALCAGATVWFLAYFYTSVGLVAMGVFPANVMTISLLWGLGEMLLAAVAGAWLYQEQPSPSAARV